MNNWVVGWNMPGYLPDNPPEGFSDFTDAVEFLLSELKLSREYEENPGKVILWDEAIDSVVENVELNEDFAVFGPDHYVYFVAAGEDDVSN